MSWSGHETVMKAEVVERLRPEQGGVFVDGTLGGGGHTEALLRAARDAGQAITLMGVDRDPDALAFARERLSALLDERRVFLPVQGNYRDIPRLLQEQGLGLAQGLVVDAGVSSHQLDTAARGFSFMREGPLDMRMGSDAVTVEELIRSSDEVELTRILKQYGEVRRPRRIARAILGASGRGELKTTLDLAKVCGEPTFRDRIHPATRVFQALRIAANDELGALEELVRRLGEVLAPGGRCAFISFHSLEDRIVKHGLRELENPCTCPVGLPMCACGAEPIVRTLGKVSYPTDAEVEGNPRSRSARLRCAERI